MRRFLIVFVLACASVHCVLSIFYVNRSWLDLHAYARGQAAMPFQGRLLMVPVVRWAESNEALQRLALRYSRSVPQFEPMSAAKLICVLVGIGSVLMAGALTVWCGRWAGVRSRWLPWALLVATLMASYAARYEQTLWYPYDLPHMAVFGAAVLFVLGNRPWLFLLSLTVDIALRETALFVILLALVLHYRSSLWRGVLLVGVAGWGFSRWLAHWLYPSSTPFENIPLYMLRFLAPWHIPQLLSIVGFLWIPVWLGRRWLSVPLRRCLYVATFCMGVSFYFATWSETRVWLEWSVLFAVLASVELEGILGGIRREIVD